MAEETAKMETDNTEDISPDSDGGILKKILVEGTGHMFPRRGADVTVHYTGTLTDGSKFDSSRDRSDPFTFKLGKGQVIKGWDEGVKTMKLGEKAIFTLKPEYAYGASGSPPKIPANATLIFEVELLSWQDEQDLTGDGGVLKRIEKDGADDDHKIPKDDSTVTINYKLRIKDDIVDQKTNFNFVVGAEEVISGLEKAVVSMHKGETSFVKISPQYGYGSEGNKELNIPGDVLLEYEIELVDFTYVKESWEMDTPEKFEAFEKYKASGNDYFKLGKYDHAVHRYNLAIEYIDSDYSMTDEEKKKCSDLKVLCYNNIAMCQLKIKDWKVVIENCDKVLKIDPNNVKALFRRGTAFTEQDEYEKAKTDLKKALEIDAANKDVKNQLARLQQRENKLKQKEKAMFGNMFAKLAKDDAK